MTTVSEQLYQQAQRLPESVQLEVLHYMEYLMQRKEFSRQADEREQEESSQRLYQIMSEAAKRGTAVENIDVLAWQKEQRQDRPIFAQNQNSVPPNPPVINAPFYPV